MKTRTTSDVRLWWVRWPRMRRWFILTVALLPWVCRWWQWPSYPLVFRVGPPDPWVTYSIHSGAIFLVLAAGYGLYLTWLARRVYTKA